MELQMKYQYTYFIYPYVIDNKSHSKYISKLLNNKKIELTGWRKDKNLNLYNFFLPSMRKYMFNNFETVNNNSNNVVENLVKENALFFNYKLEKDIQGKVGSEDGIFFQIQQIHIICFKCGLCFLIFKTNVENSTNFSDVLNFNYKFRDINSEYGLLKEYENIRIQTDTFENMKKLTEFINEITDNANKDNKIDTNRFYTYSYVCIEQEYWNNQNQDENLEKEFMKFANVLPSNYNTNKKQEEKDIFDDLKYTKLGITENGVALLCSSIDNKNYTFLSEKYENEYLYLYIISLYEKLYSKKIIIDIKDNLDIAKNEYINLKQEFIISNITNEIEGNSLYAQYRKVLKLDELSEELKSLFDIKYKKLDIDKNKKTNKILLIILTISLLLNIVNFVILTFYK